MGGSRQNVRIDEKAEAGLSGDPQSGLFTINGQLTGLCDGRTVYRASSGGS